MTVVLVIGTWRTEKGKRQRIRAFGGERKVEDKLTALAPRREEGAKKIFHPFSKTNKKIISISFSEINDKLSVP